VFIKSSVFIKFTFKNKKLVRYYFKLSVLLLKLFFMIFTIKKCFKILKFL